MRTTLLTGIVLLLTTTAYAGGSYTPPVPKTINIYKTFNEYVNNTYEVTNLDEITHYHIDKRRTEIGAGADLILWEAEADIRDSVLFREVTAEYRYDWQNAENKVYVVSKVNLWGKIKRWLKK